jgi:hypothetical protein
MQELDQEMARTGDGMMVDQAKGALVQGILPARVVRSSAEANPVLWDGAGRTAKSKGHPR